MANITLPYTFSDDTDAEAAQVNANLAELVGFLTNEVVHRDGSKSLTGFPALPGDPTAANQPTRKSYVDAVAAAAEANAKTYADTKVSGNSMTGTSPIVGVHGGRAFIKRAGYNVGTTDAFGDITVSWAPFPNGVASVVPALVGDFPDCQRSTAVVRTVGLGGCRFRLCDPTNGFARPNHEIRVTWEATGF